VFDIESDSVPDDDDVPEDDEVETVSLEKDPEVVI